MERCLTESNAVDLESLCIVPGEKVFKIECSVRVIDNVGNLSDACCLALISSLKHFRRPEVYVNGKETKIYSIEEREPVPLTIHHIPISLTYGLFRDVTCILYIGRRYYFGPNR